MLDGLRERYAVGLLAEALNVSGEIKRRMSMWDDASRDYRSSHYYYESVARVAGDVPMFNLAIVDLERGRFQEARESFARLKLFYSNAGREADEGTCDLGLLAARLGEAASPDELRPAAAGGASVVDAVAELAAFLSEKACADADVPALWGHVADQFERLGCHKDACDALGHALAVWQRLSNGEACARVGNKMADLRAQMTG